MTDLEMTGLEMRARLASTTQPQPWERAYWGVTPEDTEARDAIRTLLAVDDPGFGHVRTVSVQTDRGWTVEYRKLEG